MKRLLLIVAMLTMCACQNSNTSNTTKAKRNIVYFKDERTGLCFAAVNSASYAFYETTSIACVPCDSVERFINENSH